jgi:cyclase
VGFVLLVLGAGALHLYDRVDTLEPERVTDDVSVVFGFGGNVGVLRTAKGAVVVDSMTFAMQGRALRELAERLGGGPVQAVVNSHYHTDHSHGNPGFAPGTHVVATRRTLDYMRFFDGDYWAEADSNAPNDLVEGRHELRIGGKTVRLLHPGRGHTGGDLVAHFVEDRVIHTGDLFFNGAYPNIDLEAGGSVREWIGTLDRVLALDFERVIPGHGPVTDRDGLVAFQDFLKDLWEQASTAAAARRTLRETLASVDLRHDAGYDVLSFPLLFELDRDFVVRRAWEEASGVVGPAEVPPAKP